MGAYKGRVAECHSTGAVSGKGAWVGGLVGLNYDGRVTQCYSTMAVTGSQAIGGLVGGNSQMSMIAMSHSTARVHGDASIGGLAGWNLGNVTQCYSTGAVNGTDKAGGLVGIDYVSRRGVTYVGQAVDSFWDSEASGRTTSAGGTGKTTAEMQTASTFLEAGWDFVGESANGTEDIWWILEGKDYPRLWWELWLEQTEGDAVGPAKK